MKAIRIGDAVFAAILVLVIAWISYWATDTVVKVALPYTSIKRAPTRALRGSGPLISIR